VVIMNRITISLIFFIVISMVLPTSAIMYASGQSTDNSDDSSGGGSTTTTDNSGSSSTGGSTDSSGSSSAGGTTTTDNSGSSSTGGGATTTDNSDSSSTGGGSTTTTDNSGSSTGGGSTDNSATLPTISTASGNTGNALQQSNNGTIGILGSSNNETAANFANNILAVHNTERATVGVPPLVWSDKLAADAKTWADYMATTHNFRHDTAHLGNLGEGENLNAIVYNLGDPPSTAKLQEGWVNEKNYYQQWATNSLPKTANWTGWYPGHYNQMVWNTSKEVGCATGFTSGLSTDTRGVYLDCRYSPPGNYFGQKPY
jgi:uncharacterized protein YkwD